MSEAPQQEASRDNRPQWEKDFPISVGEDNYVARRDFTKFLVLTSGALAVGQACVAVGSLGRDREALHPERRIAAVGDVEVGGAVRFMYPTDHDPCLLLRLDADRFVAYSQACTHLSCAVVPDLERGQVACPCHRGFFDAITGKPTAGPPRRPLPRITLSIRDGEVFATGVEVSTT